MKLKNLKKRKGVTIIELMVVIAILGVLMTIIYVNIKPDPAKMNNLHFRTSKVQLEGALFNFHTDYRRYPTTDEGLEALINPPAMEDGTVPSRYLEEKFIKDPWNSVYQYEYTDGEYKIISLGADNQPGGEGENKDVDLSQY